MITFRRGKGLQFQLKQDSSRGVGPTLISFAPDPTARAAMAGDPPNIFVMALARPLATFALLREAGVREG